MKFVEEVSLSRKTDDGIVLQMQRLGHEVRIQVLEDKLFRVSLTVNRKFRFPKTWSIAPGDDIVPFEGQSRDNIAERFSCPRFSIQEGANGCELSSGDATLKVHYKPYFLEWKFRGKTVLQERKTGALALSARDERLWHCHELNSDTEFYGLGETSGKMNKRGRRLQMRNLDAMGYDAELTDPLYKHFPYMIHRSHGVSVGLYYDNSATTTFNLGQEIDNYHGPYFSYQAECGDFDLYVMFGPEIRDVVKTFNYLTGRMTMPPKWSLSYSGSTMTYTDSPNAQGELEGFLDKIKEEQIPCRSFHLSSGYTSIGPRRYVFNWNRDKIPNPAALIKKFNDHDVRLIPNVKPVFLNDHPLFTEAKKKSLFIQDSEKAGEPDQSQFWDGKGSHLDFTNPQTVEFWKSQIQSKLLALGIDAIWNDNNEFEIWDDEAKCHGFGNPWPIKYGRCIQTLIMAMASRAALEEQNPKQRAFVVSRSGMPGMQRYVQTWSGDNRTEWKTLKFNLAMALSLGLSGVANTGHDVGGFAGPLPSPELFLRWIQHGIFYPRFVIHSWKDGQVNEPWMYPEILPLVRSAMRLRETLIPYFYNALKISCDRFEPFLRPLFFEFEHDKKAFEFASQFMVGPSLMVAGVLEPGINELLIYFPDNKIGWVDFNSGKWFAGGAAVKVNIGPDSIPMFVQAGHALPLASARDNLEIRFFPGPEIKEIAFSFFDDDGLSKINEGNGGYYSGHAEVSENDIKVKMERLGAIGLASAVSFSVARDPILPLG